MRLFVLSRHAQSTLNVARLVNGNPSVPAELTETGVAQALELGLQLAHLPLDACVHTRFGRTRRTAELALGGRGVPLSVEPLLDDVRIGALEGKTVEEYRAWKALHGRDEPFPGGESLNDAARRYAEGFRRVLAGPQLCVLVVCHEIPIRYAHNAAAGSADLDAPVHDIPNATPFLFDEDALAHAADRIEELLAPPTGVRSRPAEPDAADA